MGPLFWTSGDVCPGFQSQGGFPHLCASLPVCNRISTFGATTTDLLVASMSAGTFQFIYLCTSIGGA